MRAAAAELELAEVAPYRRFTVQYCSFRSLRKWAMEELGNNPRGGGVLYRNSRKVDV